MNAACALQHFCDIHGPQILLCTEERTYIHDLNDNDNEGLKAFYAQYIKSEHNQEKVECKSCTLSPDGVLVSTVDALNHMLYISSPSTPNQELFKNIRNACLRSLNIEKSTENGHPVLFGDDEDGYCLSLAFSCKDFQARGSQRLYSLCYLCNDKDHLISLMAFLRECMREAVYWLQNDADITYEQEGHIKVNTDLKGATTTYVMRPPPRAPSQRTLSEIVQDPNIAYRIHALFVWILRTSHSAIHESLFDALPTEEQVTKLERKNASENEQISSQRTRPAVQTSPSIQPNHNSDYTTAAFGESIDYDTYNENGFYNDDDDDDDYDSLEYQFSSYGSAALRLFKSFIKQLNNIKHLQYILYNWIIGNQLIIKYTNGLHNEEFIRAFASVFRLFLPDGCCSLLETTDPIASCTANLILFDTDLFITTNEIDTNNDNNSITLRIIFDTIDNPIRLAKLEVLPRLKSDIIIPSYVRTIIEVLMDDSLDEEAFEAIITHHKIKYLNKAKLYFQFGHCQIASTLSFSERQEMDLLQIKNPSDLSVIRFWKKGLSDSYKTHIRTLRQDDKLHKQQLNHKANLAIK